MSGTPRRIGVLGFALSLIAVACTSSAPDAAPPPTGEPTTTLSAPTSSPSTSSPPTTAPTPSGAQDPTAGAPGIGDPYYPHLGNGGYDVEHYDIAVDYLGNGTIAAATTIEAVATQDLSAFNLDFEGFEIEDVTVNGTKASYERSDGELTVAPTTPVDQGSALTIVVRYAGETGPFRSAATSIPIGWLEGSAGEQYVMGVADGAHSWFPANDHPLDKATYSFDLTVPDGYLGAANGELTSDAAADGTANFQWAMDSPMAPYLATVVIGEGYTIVDDPASTAAAGVEVRNVLPPDLAASPPEALAKTGEMIVAAEDWFGPYPFERYGIAVAGDVSAALETQTLSVFGRPMVEHQFFEFVLVHELAHQWFGDSVSPAGWDDIWLSEGFATMAELLWIEHEFGGDAYAAEVARRSREVETAGYAPPGNPPPDDLFNRGVYERGGLTLVALRDLVGDDDFFEILRTHTTRHRHANATTEDFIATAEEVSGKDLKAFFAAWLSDDDAPQPA